MRTILALAAVFGIVAPALAQEPPKPVPAQPNPATPKLPLPPYPGSMSVVSAQAVADKGKLSLFVVKNEPAIFTESFTFTEQVPVKVLKDDGKGGKVEKTVMESVTRQGARYITKYVPTMKQYLVSGNEKLTVTDVTGKKLSDGEVLKALEKPAFVFEFTDKPNADFLKTLKPHTVVLVWKSRQPTPPAAVPVPAAPVPPKK